jgi:hypothetical protein
MKKSSNYKGKGTLLRLLVLVLFLVIVSSGTLFPGNLETVKVDLKKREFTSALPFDTKFYITGSVGEDVRKVVVSYVRIDKKWGKYRGLYKQNTSWNPKDFEPEYGNVWKRIKGDTSEQEFKVIVGPLHANKKYLFFFEFVTSAITMKKDIFKIIKENLVIKDDADFLNKFVETIGRVDKNKKGFAESINTKMNTVKLHFEMKFGDIQETINKKIKSVFAKKIEQRVSELKGIKLHYEKEKCEKKGIDYKNICEFVEEKLRQTDRLSDSIFVLDFEKEPYSTLLDLAVEKYDYIKENQIAINEAIKAIHNKKVIIHNLSKILKRERLLASPFANVWNMPINYKLKEFKKTTMADVARMIVDGDIKKVLKGKARIEGNNVFPAEAIDIHSIKLLLDFFNKVKSRTFCFKSRNPKPVFENQNEIWDIIAVLEDIIENTQKLDEMPTRYSKSIEKLDDELNKIQLENEIEKFVSEINIPTERKKNPFVSLDFGAGYAFKLNSPFFYTGVNLSLTPVNKLGSSRIFKPLMWIKKRTNLLIGITNGMVNEGNYENLFTGGNLIVGGGIRLSYSLKINGGCIVFREIDPNPIVDNTKIRFRPFISISFDSSWESIIGRLHKIF